MKTYYNAVNSGNWNDPNTWNNNQGPSNQVTGIVTITIQSGINVTIPNGLEVSFDSGVTLQIIGGSFTLSGSLTIVKNSFDTGEGNDHSINDSGAMVIEPGGVLDLTIQGNSYPLNGLVIANGSSLTNNGTISLTCRTGTVPNIALAFGISNSGSLTNNGVITIDSPDNINNGGYGPSFGIKNRDNANIINNTGAYIKAKSGSGAIGGGIINNTDNASFQNNGSFDFKNGQFWNAGSFSGIAIGECSLEASATSTWQDRLIGPMSGNKDILIAFNGSNSWYIDASTVQSGVILKKGGNVSGESIASAGYLKSEFIAVGPYVNHQNKNQIFKSTDGKNWSSVYSSVSGTDVAMNAVIFGSESIVAVGHDTNNGLYAVGNSSADSWDTGTISGITLKEIAFGDVGIGAVANRFLATSSTQTFNSKDGKSWTKKDDSSKSKICYSPTYKFFYGIVQNTGLVYKTGNGEWTANPIGKIWDASVETNHINDFIWSEEAKLFIAVGSEGTIPTNGELPSAIFTSTDGITWSTNRYNGGKELLKVAYGAGIFVAVGYNNTIIQIIT